MGGGGELINWADCLLKPLERMKGAVCGVEFVVTFWLLVVGLLFQSR